ncbi:hypothetical protein [Methylobacterium nodulans]|uniref:hypothetical protein n=1 Tax=Methylobacterium nodulans TaxID=114616 RepID=UPI0012ED1ED1|nr:hypothetical protein [Methylobacterium nodulans]
MRSELPGHERDDHLGGDGAEIRFSPRERRDARSGLDLGGVRAGHASGRHHVEEPLEQECGLEAGPAVDHDAGRERVDADLHDSRLSRERALQLCKIQAIAAPPRNDDSLTISHAMNQIRFVFLDHQTSLPELGPAWTHATAPKDASGYARNTNAV